MLILRHAWLNFETSISLLAGSTRKQRQHFPGSNREGARERQRCQPSKRGAVDDDKRQCMGLAHRIASHRTSGSPLALRGSVVQGWRAGRPGRAPVTRPFVARRSLSRNIRIVARPGDCTRRRARSTSASVDTNNFEQHSMMICPFFLTLLQRTSLTP